MALVLLHGFTDSPRTWELVAPALSRVHELVIPALPGHFGGPPLTDVDGDTMADHVEAVMDARGIGRAHLVGNSLGGHVALQLAARGRGESVVALCPAGGWDGPDPSVAHFDAMLAAVRRSAPHADAIVATPEGRRRASRAIMEHVEHVPPDLLAHQIRAAAVCDAEPLRAHAARAGWALDAAAIDCPVRIVWGVRDRILRWPDAAARYRRDWLPHADWVELEDCGHCPQLDLPLETAQLTLGFP